MQTSGDQRREKMKSCPAVIASAAKQPTSPLEGYGLLRFARKDGVDGPRRHRCARLVLLIRPDKGAVHDED